MPRGYLKHSKGVGKKQARGGSSRYCAWASEKRQKPSSKNNCTDDDFSIVDSSKSDGPPHIPNIHVGECSICFEEVPVLYLSQKCRWHDSACSKCLHRIYVVDAQKDVKNYPLTCFHPLCNQPIQAAQLEKYSLFASRAQARKHHEMLVLSKIKSTEGMRTVLCPNCQSPRGINKLEKDRTYGCNNCKIIYKVSPDYATIRALENMASDDYGCNDGWAKCPRCSIIISKGDGCDHMECSYCYCDFSWEKAQHGPPLARPPDAEIYLWW